METHNMIPVYGSYLAYSFDVFDTVLTRCYKEPKHLFEEVEQRLVLEGISGVGFGLVRVEAELRCRERSQFLVEVSLDEIYAELGRLWDAVPGDVERAKILELQLERDSVVEHRPMVDTIDRLRKTGKKIIFISDIYLPERFVRSLLVDLRISRDEDLLYVSSSYKKMKAWGDLFDVALTDTGIAPHEICHIGDNFRSDVVQAHGKGLTAIHAKRLLATRYDNVIPQGNAIASKLAGASRATRAQNPYPAGHSSIIWDTTAQVAGPLLFAFAAWCMMRAKTHSINTMFYLARDGQIIKSITDIIGNAFPKLSTESRYLYVSRQSLLLPGMVSLTEEQFDWILARTDGLSFRDVMQRIRIDFQELDMSPNMIDKWGGIDAPLSEEAILELKSILYGRKYLIEERSTWHRNILLRYLEQEGFLKSQSVGIVDIGWNGTLQRALSSVLKASGAPRKIYGQYFGIRKKPNVSVEYNSLEAWFTSPENLAPIEAKTYIVPMMELFTAADHGGTIGYDLSATRVSPVFRSQRNTKALEWGLSVQHDALLAFSRNALRVFREDEISELPDMSKEYTNALLEEFMLRPSQEEAAVYCAYEDAEDQNEVRYRRIGRPYDFRELNLYFSEDYMHHHNEWRQGALAITKTSLVDLAWRLHCARTRV